MAWRGGASSELSPEVACGLRLLARRRGVGGDGILPVCGGGVVFCSVRCLRSGVRLDV